MSTTIDEKVVEMRFDNKQFESNVATSMSTLEKLKRSLNLTGASKGLEDVGTATKRVNMSELGRAVDSVKAKFSALQVVGVTALANITNSAINAGKSIVKSLTIDPVKSGLNEYETKMGSIQTILANTEYQGTTLDDVTAALDRLNLYADKTIYNFQEMTRNIGTFTAAGVDLETSVRSIQGIANLAAISGSTSQQASTAMYQLSQALATGTVKLQDWNSVVNAGMGGKVFQNALIQTAAVLDGAADNVAAWQAKNIDAFGSFRESLSRGGWLTSEVLTRTLEQFTMAAEEGSKTWEEYKKSLMNTGYTEAQAESILKMANTASDAATKVKTFTQLMDTLKESAQSGWAQSWEIIIGDFEEAKASLTELSDLLGGAIGKSADRRNNFLSEVFTSNWDKLISRINEAGVETEQFEESLRKVAGGDKLDGLIEKYGSLEDVFRSGALEAKYLQEALEELGAEGKEAGEEISKGLGEEITKGLSVDLENFFQSSTYYKEGKPITLSFDSPDKEQVEKIQTALNELGFEIPISGEFKSETRQAVIDFQKSVGLAATGVVDQKTIDALIKAGNELERVATTTKEVSSATGEAIELSADAREEIDGLIDGIGKMSGRELVFGTISNILQSIVDFLGVFREAWDEAFSVDRQVNGLYNILSALYKFSESLIMSENTANKLKSTFKGVIAVFDILTSIVGGALKAAFDIIREVFGAFSFDALNITRNIGDVIVAFRDWLKENDIIAKMFEKIISIAKEGINIVKGLLNSFAKLPIVSDIISKIRLAFIRFSLSAKDMDHAMGKVIQWFKNFKNLSFVQAILKKIKSLFESLNASIPKVVDSINKWFDAFKKTEGVQKLIDAVKGLIDAFKKLFAGEIDSSEFATLLGENLGKALASLPEIAMQIAKDFIAGFQNGISESASNVISKIIEFCANFITAFASALGIHSPSVIAEGDGVNFMQGFINGIKAMLSSVVGIFKKVGEVVVKVFKGLWDSITDENGNVDWDKIFVAGILVSSVWFLKKLVDIVGGIASVFDGVGDVLKSVSNAVDSFSKVLNSVAWDIKAQAIQKMAIAIAILVASIWVLTQIDDVEKIWNAVGVIFALAVILGILAAAMNKLSSASLSFDGANKKLNLDGIKSGLLQIGLAILLVAASVKLLGGIDDTAASKGFERLAAIVVGMIGFVAVLGAISRYSKDVGSIGKMMIKLSVAMILMIAVCKLASKLSIGEMWKGAVFASAFAIFVAFLVNTLTIGNDKKIAKVGKLLLSVSFSLILMIAVCKLASKLSIGEMWKGAVFASAFAIFVAFLVNILKIGNKEQIANVASTILAISAAIAILAAVCALLGFIDTTSLIKGIVAVGLLSAMMTLMIKSLKGAQNAKGAIMMMAIAIGVMTASIVALSFIDIASVLSSAAALSAMMVAFSFMIKTLKGLKVGDSLKGALSLLALMVPLVAFVGILYLLDGVDGSTEKIIALTGAMAAFVIMLAALTLIGKLGAKAIIGVGSLLALMVSLGAFVYILKALDGIDGVKEKILSLVTAMAAMTLLLGVLTIIGFGGPAAIIGVGSLLGLFAAIGLLAVGIGALMTSFPEIEKFLDTGLPILERLAGSIGTMIGNFVTGIGVAVTDGFATMADNLSVCMDKLKEACDKASGINGDAFNGVGTLLGVIGDIALLSVGTTLSDIFNVFLGSGTSMDKFRQDGVAFFGAMKAIGEASSGVTIDEASMESIIGIATKLTELQSSVDNIGGVITFFTGRDDLGTFGINAAAFILSMKTAMEALPEGNFNTEAMGYIIEASTKLTELQSSVDNIGGVITFFTGRDDLGRFGINAAAFIFSMKTAMDALPEGNFNTEAMGSIIDAATKLTELQSSVDNIGGVITFFTGRDDLGAFGVNAAAFIFSMKTAMKDLGNSTFNADALGSVVSAGVKLAELQGSLKSMGGVITWFTGKSDLGTFGTKIGEFAGAMATLKTSMGENGIPESVTTSLTNAGNAIVELQKALPTTSWFDGKMDLTTFSGYVTNFGNAMSGFGTAAASIDSSAIRSTISSAYSIKDFINSISDLNTSNLGSIIGAGFSDGAIVDIGQTMSKFSKEVSNADTKAMTTSVDSAIKLKDLINSLSEIDASGIDSFKPSSIGESIKNYSDKVAGIDSSAVTNSITAAYKIKSFISSLSGMKSDGVSAFASAVNNLSAVNFNGVVDMVNGYSTTMQSSGLSLASGLNAGLEEGLGSVSGTINSTIRKTISLMMSKASRFASTGRSLTSNLANGIRSGSGSVSSSMSYIASTANSRIRNYYYSFYDAGEYLVMGLAQGITDNEWRAINAAIELAKSAIDAAEEEAGVESPSKVFKQIGAYCVDGFVIGLEDIGNRVSNASAKMADSAIHSTREAMATVLSNLNNDIDSQPTIRPIIDLSDVKTGAAAIEDMFNETQMIGIRSNLNSISSSINSKLQNSSNDDIISAINRLSDSLNNARGDTYTIEGVTYDDSSNISDTIKTLVRYSRIGGRV